MTSIEFQKLVSDVCDILQVERIDLSNIPESFLQYYIDKLVIDLDTVLISVNKYKNNIDLQPHDRSVLTIFYSKCLDMKTFKEHEYGSWSKVGKTIDELLDKTFDLAISVNTAIDKTRYNIKPLLDMFEGDDHDKE